MNCFRFIGLQRRLMHLQTTLENSTRSSHPETTVYSIAYGHRIERIDQRENENLVQETGEYATQTICKILKMYGVVNRRLYSIFRLYPPELPAY